MSHMTGAWERLEQRAAQERAAGAFESSDIEGLPIAAQRYLKNAIAPDTPLAQGARLTMQGSLKLGRWLPFTARQLLVPHLGTVWRARVGGLISGSDSYVDGVGSMCWKLCGVLPVMRASGPEVSRSAAERAAAESIWTPTAMVRSATFSSETWTELNVGVDVGPHHVDLVHHVDEHGRLTASSLQRWGDPDRTGRWAATPFGMEVTSWGTFDGVCIPVAGRVGWHYGTDRWQDGVFFRFEITRYELLL